MFQFSDDFDEEDFLTVPLDGTLNENDKNYINQDEYPKDTPKSEPKDRICDSSIDTAFGPDDDDLILSVVENVDASQIVANTSINDIRPSKSSFHDQSLELVPETKTFTTPRSTKRTVSFNDCNSGSSSSASSSNTSDHRLIVTNDSPSTPRTTHRVEYERKFPGPAGLIPKKSRRSMSSGAELNDSALNQQLCVQIADDDVFENGPWEELLKDINSKSCELLKIINEYSVAAIKRMNIIKHTSRRIPLFAGVIINVDCSLPDPSIILKDLSGEIRGTLMKDSWEEYGHLLTVGNALLLRQISLLSINNLKMPYLNITGNNIDTIYSTPQGGGKKVLVTRVAPPVALHTFYENVDKLDTSIRSEPVQSKCDDSKSTRHSPFNQSSKPISSGKETISTSGKFSISSTCINEEKVAIPSAVINELDGIDVDSMFGDF